MMNEKIRRAGRLVREANMDKRRALAKKHGLTVSDFMPKHIRATMKRHRIPESAVPANLIPSAGDPFPGVPMDAGESIPLSAIPGKRVKGVRREYDVEFKKRAVAMFLEKPIKEVARELDVAENVLRLWGRTYDPAWAIRAEMLRASEARRQRLEVAAVIVEHEGQAELAKRIRALAKPK